MNKAVIILVFIGLIITVLYLFVQRVDRYLEFIAIKDCADAYRIEFNDTAKNTRIIRPLEGPFRECVWNKGVKSW